MFNQFTFRSLNSMNQHIDAIGDSVDNINNLFTTGYKAKKTSFHETFKGLRKNEHRDHSSGVAKETKRDLDFAIQGVGMFEVQMPDGTLAYTRNGSFQIGKNGELLSSQGYALTNQSQVTTEEINNTYDSITGEGAAKFSFGLSGQSIQIPTGSDIRLAKNGELQGANGETLGKLVVVTFPNLDGLKDVGNGLLVPTEESGQLEEVSLGSMEGQTEVKQGYLESSNMAIMDDTAKVVQLNSAVKAEMKVIKLLDQLQESLNSTITRNI